MEIVILRLINLNLEFYSDVQLLQSSYKSMEIFYDELLLKESENLESKK